MKRFITTRILPWIKSTTWFRVLLIASLFLLIVPLTLVLKMHYQSVDDMSAAKAAVRAFYLFLVCFVICLRKPPFESAKLDEFMLACHPHQWISFLLMCAALLVLLYLLLRLDAATLLRLLSYQQY